MWILATVIAIAVIAAMFVLLGKKWRSARSGGVRPYGKVRQTLIGAIADANAPARSTTRPPGLDTRLPAKDAQRLRELGAPCQDNVNQLYEQYDAVIDSIRRELEAIDRDSDRYDLLSPGRRAVYAAWSLSAEVNNGGFDQYYLNSSGDGAHLAPESLRLLGLPQVAALVERGNAQFPGGPSPLRERRLAQMDALPESARAIWSELDSEFYGLGGPLGGLDLVASLEYILAHEEEFFRKGAQA